MLEKLFKCRKNLYNWTKWIYVKKKKKKKRKWLTFWFLNSKPTKSFKFCPFLKSNKKTKKKPQKTAIGSISEVSRWGIPSWLNLFPYDIGIFYVLWMLTCYIVFLFCTFFLFNVVFKKVFTNFFIATVPCL